MAYSTTQRQSQSNPGQELQVDFLSLLVFLMGIGFFAAIFYAVLSNDSIVGTGIESFGTRFWNFMTSMGVLRPVLGFAAGFALIRLSIRLRSRHIAAARWTGTVFTWAIFLNILGILWTTYTSLASERTSGEASGSDFILNVIPWAILLFILVTGYVLLIRNMHVFAGDEDIFRIRTRTAWNLLAPTLIVFLMVGIGPLEQVFITSLTDERFASSDTVNFVGLNNYGRLLGLRVDTLPCETDETTGGCLTELDENGNTVTVYPSARRFLVDTIESYRPLGYRPMDEITLFGTRYIISARDEEFIQATITSLIYAVVSIFFQVTIGMGIAMVLAAKVRGLGPLRVALLVPLAIPTLIATQFWEVMLDPTETGVANSLLMGIGAVTEPQRWLLDRDLMLPSVILVIVWKETPSMALLLLPGLVSISPDIYQASSVDGANRWQQFWRITIPIMRPTIGVALVLRTMVMIRVFDVFEILLGTRKFAMATYAHDVLIQRQELGYSSTISVAIFFVILFFTIIYMRSLRIDET